MLGLGSVMIKLLDDFSLYFPAQVPAQPPSQPQKCIEIRTLQKWTCFNSHTSKLRFGELAEV